MFFFHSLTPAGRAVLPLYGAIFLISIGSYGFWRIPKDYKVTKIVSDYPLEEKKQIIEDYILLVKGEHITMDEAIVKFQYRNTYWNSVNVHIAVDKDSFLLNAKSVGIGSSGFIDFGLGRRALKKVETYFNWRATKL